MSSKLNVHNDGSALSQTWSHLNYKLADNQIRKQIINN